MLRQIHVENIKSLRDVTLDLGQVTALVGPNGCGKSTLLDQIALLCEVVAPNTNLDPLMVAWNGVGRQGGARILSAGATGVAAWMGAGETGQHAAVQLWLGAGAPPASDITRVAATTGAQSATYTQAGQASDRDAVRLFLQTLPWRALRLRLQAQEIARPAPLVDDPTDLHPSGFGLPVLLSHLALNERASFDAIEADLRRVVPLFERVHFRPTASGETGQRGFALDLSLRGAGRIDATQVSEGTLHALALLTVLHAQRGPAILLMDDLDHGLHLSAQAEVLRAVRAVLALRPDVQVVFTTHSPYLLDAVQPEEVRVMSQDEHGASRCVPLTQHPEFARWSRGLQTGELWATLGESWTLKAAHAG